MPISLTKDFILNIPDREVVVEGIGRVTLRDVGMEMRDELRRFYNKALRPNYILGHEPLFKWMFRNNGSKVAVLMLGNKIIAHQGHVPIVFSLGSRDFPGFISATTVVDENFRRRGLMTLLRGSVQDRYEMACSIGGSDDGIALYKTMGYRFYGYLKRMAAIVNPDDCHGIAENPEKLKPSVSLTDGGADNVREIKDFFAAADEIAALLGRVFGPDRFFGAKRNAEFFDWRYAQHPVYDYQCYGLWRDKKLQALIVYRREEVPEIHAATIRITELIGSNGDIAEIVKSAVLTRKTSADVGWIDFFCANQKIADALRAVGFASPEELPAILPIFCNPVDYSKAGYPVMLWSRDESVHATLPPFEEWYLTKGDGDADRPNQLI